MCITFTWIELFIGGFMHSLELEFGTLEIFENYIIGNMKEAYDIRLSDIQEIINIAHQEFGEQPWAYISNRTHPYTLSPTVHTQAPMFEKNLIAFAVVATDSETLAKSEIEDAIHDKSYEFRIFQNLEKAVEWVKSLFREKTSTT